MTVTTHIGPMSSAVLAQANWAQAHLAKINLKPVGQLVARCASTWPLSRRALVGWAVAGLGALSLQLGAVAQSTFTPSALPDGQYLYGQVPEPNQMGQGYLVFEVTNGQIQGGLYFPSSSFDCFSGQVQGDRLALTITNSYTQETYAYAMALAAPTTVASEGAAGTLPLEIDGFYRLGALGDVDRQVLQTCAS